MADERYCGRARSRVVLDKVATYDWPYAIDPQVFQCDSPCVKLDRIPTIKDDCRLFLGSRQGRKHMPKLMPFKNV
jgi:hypothetical protein